MKHRSKFEDKIAKHYPELDYECVKLKYIVPATKHYYIPDFRLITKSGKVIWIEAKGLFTPKDRKKMLLVKEQYPDYDIRFLFQNPNVKISKTSQTTAAEWCIKNNFKFGNIDTLKKWKEE